MIVRMEGLRIDKSSFPTFKKLLATGEMPEELFERMLTGEQEMLRGLDKLLDNGEGELSLEECDRLGTELPPGLYRYIKVTTDGPKPKVLATIYLRTIDSELDEMWLARVRQGMPPNPLDSLPGNLSYCPLPVEEAIMPYRAGTSKQSRIELLPDAAGSQGVKGARPTLRVKVRENPDGDHRWCFPHTTVRSTVLAPVLLGLREAGERKVGLKMLQMTIDYYRTSAAK